MPNEIDIKNLAPDDIESLLLNLGEDKYRTAQIVRWLYQRAATSFDDMTNLSKKLREKLSKASYISILNSVKEVKSNDGTRKYLFKLEDGNLIESVLIPEADRLTLCISTQVGCALGCKFCLTGRGGFIRNLGVAEIINQICCIKDSLPNNERVSNLVLMGMGEPLANYNSTLKALRIITDPDGLQFSSRKVTLSTAGLVPEIKRLGKDIQVSLAVSLNATEDTTRNYLMPINRKYPLEMLLKACHEFPLPPRKKITFEYILIKGINDSLSDAKRLINILKGIRCKVNLIPFNEYPASEYKRPHNDVINSFQQVLIDSNYTSIVRASRGFDILAACGQLGTSWLNS
ncbi:MAG: 23S rRNA (adenine(2503)-C(2))-methyltransferase RlmN [Deltaproteobacteria bacterium CG12_big_fil_rev_8_21_14_0_65_43_10]|nr:MAG: 23S rRNA (adenine(2503)-C(2))-methyltransferase RlmN [Deltaproteobacteria bacterium CG12_big_fil_rev_8_21_14_0_65_43_10]PIU85632.1 MAG: 23S rRNA (adenine(2503)-C(2))-methyltransferase RlmN [Deltaproteobacteria bacterium CG06_land_8_20_14_3_00_44_19]PIX23069.1 MAG: 23S rRNA (adenine(2503)-C(2))-methyltransferase RlmN [Deltaproteobacteria bacterium CG_4_8_14_3_um_filter_43_13]PIZ20040.1 MAG: 23S rRNA (adenine(2503)-C(2))-methyltransferase RlmN [Deltaproteobacteria bacterium CG_4_10_14_0_8_